MSLVSVPTTAPVVTLPSMTPDASAQLRAPFPESVIGKLPRATCRDCSSAPSKVCSKHTKQTCKECGNWMTSAHIHLDYVGHAAVTDRLLAVDPCWTWEPMAWTADGLPLIKDGTMWLRLTVLGVTRPGIGSADGKSGADGIKEMIGDGLRNAGMRFGIAIDLWSKQDLHAAAPVPVAEPAVIDDLTRRMNALPADARKECKATFAAQLGKPADLFASQVAQAVALVATFEQQPRDPDVLIGELTETVAAHKAARETPEPTIALPDDPFQGLPDQDLPTPAATLGAGVPDEAPAPTRGKRTPATANRGQA